MHLLSLLSLPMVRLLLEFSSMRPTEGDGIAVSNPPIRMSPEIQSRGQQQRTLLIAEEHSKCCGERRITQSDL